MATDSDATENQQSEPTDGGEQLPGGDEGAVLSQDEIAALLGGAPSGDPASDEKSGIAAIVSTALVSYERLPMLEVVFDRLERMMTTSLRNFTFDNVDVTLEEISSVRFGDYLGSIPQPALIGVFKAEEWDNYGLLTVDRAMAYCIVEVLLGGRRGPGPKGGDGRPYTSIERNLVERLITVVLNDLTATFQKLTPVTFRFERLESNPRFGMIVRPSNAAVVARLRIDMEDRGGHLDVVIPYATFEPVRELLLQMFMGEKFGNDSMWENHLSSELWLTEVKINAVLDEFAIPLGEVLGWRVGSRLELESVPSSPVRLRCGDAELFRGQMGRRGSSIAVRITDRLIK